MFGLTLPLPPFCHLQLLADLRTNNTLLAVGQGLWAGLAYTLYTGVRHLKDSVGPQICGVVLTLGGNVDCSEL